MYALNILALLALGAPLVSAAPAERASSSGVTPTGPGPNDMYKAGAACDITWTPDTSGSSTWKDMTIDFMTGSNQHMTKLATVATGLDGTDSTLTSYSWTCPEVDPYSKIYFYQFTHGSEQDPTWTTRFLLASADGESVDPPQANQPENPSPAIPWGQGKLMSSTSLAASGSTGASSSSSSSASGSSSSSSTSSSASSSATFSATSLAASSSSSASQDSATDSSASSSQSSSSTSSTRAAAASSASQSGNTSGAMPSFATGSGFCAFVAVVLGAVLI